MLSHLDDVSTAAEIGRRSGDDDEHARPFEAKPYVDGPYDGTRPSGRDP